MVKIKTKKLFIQKQSIKLINNRLISENNYTLVSPSAELYSVKIMRGSTGDLSNAISGIEWAIENNISIVSMSFGLTLNQAFLFAGDEESPFHVNSDNDDAVPVQDIYILNNSINSTYKLVKVLHETHSSILGSNDLKKDIKRNLK